tara:strand:- start:1141 stop:1380 length:240 start_codon:yes stop_codon:yes gene_type:complete
MERRIKMKITIEQLKQIIQEEMNRMKSQQINTGIQKVAKEIVGLESFQNVVKSAKEGEYPLESLIEDIMVFVNDKMKTS